MWRIRECPCFRGRANWLIRLCLVGMLFLVVVQLPGSLQQLKTQFTIASMICKNLPGGTGTTTVSYTRTSTRGASTRRTLGPSTRRTLGPSTRRTLGPSTRRILEPSTRRILEPSTLRTLEPSTRGQSAQVQKKVASKPACLPGLVPQVPMKKYDKPGHPDVTVVTAFFNIGKFQKGSGSQKRGSDIYMKWGRVYQYLTNPLIMYTDSNVTAEVFRKLRSNITSMTKIITLDRKDVWAFNYLDRIRTIYANPKYPKFHPNTVVPEYSCAQHAKYSVIEDAIKHNYFNTTYFTWIDIGYFRFISKDTTKFVIVKPPNFNESRVAMNKVMDCNFSFQVETIFKSNWVCVGGGMFFGSKKILSMFIGDYRTAFERYLNMSLCNTDQQVIYSMNTVSEKKILQPKVSLQLYEFDVSGDCWFYLGYLCYRHLH